LRFNNEYIFNTLDINLIFFKIYEVLIDSVHKAVKYNYFLEGKNDDNVVI